MAVLQATSITGGLTMHGMAAGFVKLNASGAVTMDTNTYATTSQLGSYLSLSGGTMTGVLTISTIEDGKLVLRAPAGDTSQWNYINFVGTDGVRDAYFGTDGGGNPQWWRDDNSLRITLGSVATINDVQIVTNSGTWGINITGSAGSASSASSVPWTGVSAGIRSNYDLQFRPPDNVGSYGGIAFATAGNSFDAGYFLVRGGPDSDVYTQNGITLVADTGWLTLAQRSRSDRGVRIMTGASSTTRLQIDSSGNTDVGLGAGTVTLYHGGSARFWTGSDGTRTQGWAYFQTGTQGLHWPSNNWHFYPKDASDIYVRSGASDASIQFMRSGTAANYIHNASDNAIGFLSTSRSWILRVANDGSTQVYGQLTVGNGTSSDIYMTDTDENTRRIHTNSGRIGFLNTSNSWGAYCDNSGNWFSDFSMRAPIFYDSDNTAYYGNFASTSRMAYVTMDQSTGAHNHMTYGGYWSGGDWQTLTNTEGQLNIVQVNNINGGAYSNQPPNVYTYGGVLSWRTSNHSFQLYASHTGDITFKTQWNNDNYSGWRRILHESNFNSWAPTLTGGGASGTWSINITGSAGSASTASQVTINYNNDSNSTYQLLWGSGNSVYGTSQVYVNPSSDIIYARGGYISPSNPWGTADSAYFPNGITTAGGTNWVYGNTYLGNAPSNGSGAQVESNGRLYVRSSATAGGAGYASLFIDRSSAANNWTPFSFENEYGNHSWGLVARFHIQNNSGTDRPSIQFSSGFNNTRWSIGYVYPDDHFRITQDHGQRPDGSTNDGWGTERFRINTDGTTYLGIQGQIVYFNGSESANLYGIRGRFTNEYIHLYNKVGIGHPGGWGQGEGSTPNQGLSTYGGANFAYGTGATSTFYGHLRVTGNNNLYLDSNFGQSIIGLYASTRYQGVFAMGDAYKLPIDGTGPGNLYGLAWSHPNAGGVAGNLNTHGLLVLENGAFLAAVSGSIRARDDMRAPIFYDSNDTSYYLDPNGTSELAQITTGTRARWGEPIRWTNRQAYTSSQDYWTGTNGWGTSEGTWANAWKGGFSGWDIWGTGTDHPQGGGYIHAQGIVSGQHAASSDGSLAYGWMMVGAADATANRYWLRGKWGSTTSGWVEMITTGNIGSQSVSNADTVDGYHATAFPYRSGGSSGYYQVADWMQFNTSAGLYWPSYYNAHVEANTQSSYGSINIRGSKNGWAGINFSDSDNNLMANSNESGFHKGGYGWQFRWENGTLYCHKNSYGGGTSATVWDSVNAPRAGNSLLMYYQGFTLDANTMDANSSGFTYAVNAPYVGPIIRISEGGYSLQLNAAYSGGGTQIAFRTRNGDNGTFNPWRVIINDANIGSQSVNYANSAGNADTTDGYHLNQDVTVGASPTWTTGNFRAEINVGTWGNSSDIYMFDGDEGNRRIHCNSNRIGFLNQSNGWGSWCDDSGNWFSDYSVRAPIFYDSGDTTYYLDPNAGSVLNTVRSLFLANYYDVATDHNYGIYFASGLSSWYGIFREGGAWNWPYPDLRIAFHTGIKIGANAGYQGIRFYSDADMATIVASINDGDNNMRGYYDIIAYASDRRLKHNVKPIENALSKVISLTGMTYEWNDVGKTYGWEPVKGREAGVFAQEVQEVLPEAVRLAPFDQSHDEEGNMFSKSGENFLTVKYEKLVPLLIEAIKEQQKQIEELKAKLN